MQNRGRLGKSLQAVKREIYASKSEKRGTEIGVETRFGV
jgi:hypothetical protein